MRHCEDCGAPYESSPLKDVTLSDAQWLMIHPAGAGGVLCGACMIKRASALPGVVVIRMCIELISDKQFICDECKHA